MTSFPSASRMIGFAPCFTLHTLRRMVVLPAFALPMTRMRNWGHRWQISSGPKAPSLNGRASLDDWLSADMGREEKCTVSLEARWWLEINECRPYRKDRVSFSGQIKAVTASLLSFPRPVPIAMYSHQKPDNLPVTLCMAQESGSTLRGRPPFWTSRTAWIHDGRKAWLNTRWLTWRNLGCPLVSFSFYSFSDALALPSVHSLSKQWLSWFLTWALSLIPSPLLSVDYFSLN